MCGIFCFLTRQVGIDAEIVSQTFEIFKDNISKRGPNYLSIEALRLCNSSICISASVLWLQGEALTKQPIKNNEAIFAYNGDIFGGAIPDDKRQQRGDTQLLFNLLRQSDDVASTLGGLHGPYAFIYLDKVHNKIYFGRDIYGRRSLLIARQGGEVIITSVAKRGTGFNFIEVPAIGTFCIDLESGEWMVFSWRMREKNFAAKLEEVEKFLNIVIKDALKNDNDCSSRDFIVPTSSDLEIFCTLAKLECDNIFNRILQDDKWRSRVIELQYILESAVKKRISTQPNFCQNCYTLKMADCDHCLTSVLFSGGIDCAILALLAHKFTPKERPIDLLNVAFDRVADYKTPDRITGLETLDELRQLAPERCWNFVEIDITKEELFLERDEKIADLIYPLNTILDESLGCALWFAARGRNRDYTSPSRVVLVGMGADELFGGYTRHRAALQKSSWLGLHESLDQDWRNLSHRNLGRDDRVVSDHGRQLRTPYLDENVVEFVRNLNSWEKTYPSKDLPQGIGEKILLRSLGYYLGLRRAATFKKRALQFGSRIANKNEHAHEVSNRLT